MKCGECPSRVKIRIEVDGRLGRGARAELDRLVGCRLRPGWAMDPDRECPIPLGEMITLWLNAEVVAKLRIEAGERYDRRKVGWPVAETPTVRPRQAG